MGKVKKILIGLGTAALLLVSWFVVLSGGSELDKQRELMTQADEFLQDKVYLYALPLLEKAASYQTELTHAVNGKLKDTYLALGEKRAYLALLDKMLADPAAEPALFKEAAQYRFALQRYQEGLATLASGVEQTGDEELIALYEQCRYAYVVNYTYFEEVTTWHKGTLQVKRDGYWGIADEAGRLMIPCVYEKISTYDEGKAIVQKDGEIYTIDGQQRRLALLKEPAEDFGNLAENRFGVRQSGVWKRAAPEMRIGAAAFEAIGMYAHGYAPVCVDGQWGLIDINSEYLVPAAYDEVIADELGRCYAQDAVFLRRGETVYLFTAEGLREETYEDARPFGEEGYAAVKKDGKWGFIDSLGNLMIAYQFEDALSFGMHLAAVRQGEYWGYISRYGVFAIEPAFLDAKSFSGGSAPVLTPSGWTLIRLEEYRKGASL